MNCSILYVLVFLIGFDVGEGCTEVEAHHNGYLATAFTDAGYDGVVCFDLYGTTVDSIVKVSNGLIEIIVAVGVLNLLQNQAKDVVVFVLYCLLGFDCLIDRCRPKVFTVDVRVVLSVRRKLFNVHLETLGLLLLDHMRQILPTLIE